MSTVQSLPPLGQATDSTTTATPHVALEATLYPPPHLLRSTKTPLFPFKTLFPTMMSKNVTNILLNEVDIPQTVAIHGCL